MADTIIHVDPRILKAHPRNAEFFDDVQGPEFDRLVESIKDHGVLTPLRVTRDMTLISGHQRTRAAIKAECFSVPVIVDEGDDDNDVLMKLIETNFGRMKNDPIKQAKWLDEYMKLKGIRQGSAGRVSLEADNQLPNITQEDVAKELGISVPQLKAMKSLLKLDPSLQQLISEGRINATTGYKLLTKLTPEEQRELLDRLPDNIKFTARSIQEHIGAIRAEVSRDAMRKVNDAEGRIDALTRENNELRNNARPMTLEEQDKWQRLQQDNRENYEKWRQTCRVVDRLMAEKEQLTQQLDAERAKNQGDEGLVVLEAQIAAKDKEILDATDQITDYREQLRNAQLRIDELNRQLQSKPMEQALTLPKDDPERNKRDAASLAVDIVTMTGSFTTTVKNYIHDAKLFPYIAPNQLEALVEMLENAGEEISTLCNMLSAISQREDNIA